MNERICARRKCKTTKIYSIIEHWTVVYSMKYPSQTKETQKLSGQSELLWNKQFVIYVRNVIFNRTHCHLRFIQSASVSRLSKDSFQYCTDKVVTIPNCTYQWLVHSPAVIRFSNWIVHRAIDVNKSCATTEKRETENCPIINVAKDKVFRFALHNAHTSRWKIFFLFAHSLTNKTVCVCDTHVAHVGTTPIAHSRANAVFRAT